MTRPKGSRNRSKEEIEAASLETHEELGAKPDKAPRDRAAPKPKGPAWAKAAQVEKTLCGTIEALGLGVGFINVIDGKIIDEGAPALAKALVDLATVDPRYRKMIEGASAPGKYGPLIVAVGGIALPIAKNHAAMALDKKAAAPSKLPEEQNIESVIQGANTSSDIMESSTPANLSEDSLESATLNAEVTELPNGFVIPVSL